MKKKLLALVLAFTMCLGMPMTANAAIPMLPGSGSGSGALSSLNKDNLTIKDVGQTSTNGSKTYRSNYAKLEVNVIKSLFDPEYYAKQYPDVVLALGNNKEALWNHYVSHGLAEGRQINKDFNVLAYSAAYPDLQKAFGNDILAYYVHYMNYGKNENRQLITLEKVARAGITVTGMNGQVIANPTAVVPKINLVSNSSNNNSNENTGVDLASAVQGTINIDNNNNESGSSGSEDKKPEEVGCQHEYEVTKRVIEGGYHIINKKCTRCGNVVEGKPEDHNYSTTKDFGDGTHGNVCVCGAWEADSKTAHTMEYNYQDGTYHESKCKYCDYSVTEEHEIENQTSVVNESSHGKKCAKCKQFIETEDHKFSDGICTVCNYQHENHSWNSATGKCMVCEKTCSHEFEETAKENNSEEVHIVSKECKVCGYAEAETTEGHKFGDGQYDSGAQHIRVCSDCGWTIVEQCEEDSKPEDDGGHNHFYVCLRCGNRRYESHSYDGDGYCICGNYR